MKTLIPAAALALIAGSATAEPREVQIRSIDFDAAVVEVFSFSKTSETLAGWRFCSHDENQVRRYSSPITGIGLNPGESLFIHWNNDAPGGDPLHINASDIGGAFAGPFDSGAFSVNLYFPGTDGTLQFGNPADMIDSIQWSIDGVDNASADERSDEAQLAGLWVDQSEWIVTTAVSESITLTDTTGGLLHSPANYDVTEPFVCLADVNGDGMVTPTDFTAWINAFNNNLPECDQNGDENCTPTDFSAWINNFNAGCP